MLYSRCPVRNSDDSGLKGSLERSLVGLLEIADEQEAILIACCPLLTTRGESPPIHRKDRAGDISSPGDEEVNRRRDILRTSLPP